MISEYVRYKSLCSVWISLNIPHHNRLLGRNHEKSIMFPVESCTCVLGTTQPQYEVGIPLYYWDANTWIYIYIFTWVCIYKYIYLKQTHIKYMYVSVHAPWSWSPPLPQWGGVALPLVGVWKCVGGYANIYPQIMVGLPINNPKAKSIFAETLSSSFPTKCCTIGLPRRWHDMTCTMIPWFILLDWRMIILPYEFM